MATQEVVGEIVTVDVAKMNFQEIAEAQKTALMWAQKADVKDEKSRQEAVMIGKDCKAVFNRIEERRKEILDPLRVYTAEVNKVAKGICQPFLDAEAVIDTKLEAFAARKKAEAEAEQRRIMAEMEEKRRVEEAEQKRLAALEEKRQAEEAEKIRKAKAEALKAAKAAGDDMTAKLQAEEAAKAAAAQVEKDRAERQRKAEEEESTRQAQLSADRERLVQEMEVAKQSAQTKGARLEWKFEVVDEKEIDRMVLSLDEKKVNGLIKAGFREIKGLRIYSVMNSYKR